jgi:hypothetical protein
LLKRGQQNRPVGGREHELPWVRSLQCAQDSPNDVGLLCCAVLKSSDQLASLTQSQANLLHTLRKDHGHASLPTESLPDGRRELARG